MSKAIKATAGASVDKWIGHTLWSRWGWKGWSEDDFQLPYRDAKEKARIQSAAEFLIRSLGNSDSPETQFVVDSIVNRRQKQGRGVDLEAAKDAVVEAAKAWWRDRLLSDGKARAGLDDAVAKLEALEGEGR